jgi:ABC-2 type transport system permease protein
MFIHLFIKEIKENIASFKGLLWMMMATIMFSALTYSFITVKELSILAQASIISTFMQVVLGFGLLLTIIFAASSISNEKEQGTLESLLLTPLSKGKLVASKFMSILAIWLMIAIIATPYVITLAGGTSLQAVIILFLFGFATLFTASFTAFALALSSLLHSSKNAIMIAVAIFLIFALPAFLGTTVKKVGFGKIIDSISPLSGANNIMKDMFINKLSTSYILNDAISIIVFAVLALIFLRFATKKLTLLGGE